MTMQVLPYVFQEQLVRARLDEQGNPWFVAKDVAAVLGIQNIRQNLDGLDADEKGVCKTDTPGGAQTMTLVSESALYALIFASRKPEAKAFSKWVRSEVLPNLRKTGGYGGSPAPATKPQTEDQLILEAMQVLLSRTETLKAELAEAKPKADYYDAFVDDRDLLTFTEAGKLFGMSAQKLAAFLRDAKGTPHHWLFKGFDGANIPYQPIIDRGLMKVKHRTSSLNGMPCTQGYFTPKGIEALRKLLKA